MPVDICFDDDIQLTVYNNPKVYKLLSSVIHKKRLKDENIINIETASPIYPSILIENIFITIMEIRIANDVNKFVLLIKIFIVIVYKEHGFPCRSCQGINLATLLKSLSA